MKNLLKKSIVPTILVSMLLITACKKEQFGLLAEKSPAEKTYANLSDLYTTNRLEKIQFVTIDNSDFEGDTIITNLGTQFFFLKDAFETMDGIPVTGNIEIGFIELYTKKDMLLVGNSNMGYTSNGFTSLISGGQFYLTAKQNGQELRLKENYYYQIYNIPAENNSTPAHLFHQVVNEQNYFFWNKVEPIEDGNGSNYMSVNEYNGEYYTSNNTLGWSGIAQFTSMAGTQSACSLQLPANYTAENTSVYVSIDGVISIGELYATQSGTFASGSGYTLPVGTDVHFIIISHTNNTLKAAIIPTMITNNHLEVVSELNTVTQAELTTLLNNLP